MRNLLTVIIVLVFFIAGIMFFLPQEEMLNYLVELAAKKSGIAISWDDGRFSNFRTVLENVRLTTPENKTINISSVVIRPSLLGLSLSFKEGDMKGSLRSMLDRLGFRIENIAVSSYLPPGKLSLDGKYAARRGDGNGRFTMAFSGALFPMSSARDVSAEGTFTVNTKELSVEFDILGKGASGKGNARVAWQKDFRSSPLSGSIEVKEGGKSLKISIAGTLGAPQMVPTVQ
jgi:hypothetical protein